MTAEEHAGLGCTHGRCNRCRGALRNEPISLSPKTAATVDHRRPDPAPACSTCNSAPSCCTNVLVWRSWLRRTLTIQFFAFICLCGARKSAAVLPTRKRDRKEVATADGCARFGAGDGARRRRCLQAELERRRRGGREVGSRMPAGDGVAVLMRRRRCISSVKNLALNPTPNGVAPFYFGRHYADFRNLHKGLTELGRSGFCGRIRALDDAPNNPTHAFEEAILLGCSHA